jgi:3-hydroxybutyryl-CoA dehydratase
LFGKAVHGAIYVSQSLNFKAPVYIGSEVTASMEIIDAKVTRKGSLLKCRTVCRVVDTGVIAIDGEAKVLLPPPKIDSDSDVAPQPKRKPRGRPRTKATTTYTKGNLDVDQ